MLRRLFSAALALAMVLTLGLGVAAADSSDRVTAIIKPIDTNFTGKTDNVSPGTRLLFPLTDDMFEWRSGKAYTAGGTVTLQNLTNVTIDHRNLDTKIMKTPTLVPVTVNGSRTVCVQLDFIDNYNDTRSVDFEVTLFLRLSRTRVQASEITVSGTFGPTVKNVSSRDSYAQLGKDVILVPTENIRNFELDLDGSVSIFADLIRNRRYFGFAEDQVTDADMNAVSRNSAIETVIRVTTTNIPTAGKNVLINGYHGHFVYDKAGRYLGPTSSNVEYSELYYITSSQVESINLTGSGGTTGSTPPAASQPPSAGSDINISAPANTSAITAAALANLTTSAIQNARNNGSGTAVVTVRNASSVPASALRAMQTSVAAARLSGRFNADTMSGSSVAGRLTINTASTEGLTGDINLGVMLDSASTKSTKDYFNRWFRNEVQVISLGQKGGYGMTVNIAAKADLKNMNRNDLAIYSYDSKANSYRRLNNINYRVDNNGFLHFPTNVGNEIIISSGALVRK